MEPLSTTLLLAALGVLLIVAVIASPLSQRLGVPALAVFLVIGMVAGSEGLVGIPFDDYALGFRLGTVALVLILFDGGLEHAAAGVPPRCVARSAVGHRRSAAWRRLIMAAVGVSAPGCLCRSRF